MHRSLISFLYAAVAMLASRVVTFAVTMAEPIRRMWPEAFPTASPTPRELAPVASADHAFSRSATMTYVHRRDARTRPHHYVAPSQFIAV